MTRVDVREIEDGTLTEVKLDPLIERVDFLGNLILRILKRLGISLLVIQMLLHIDGIRPYLSPVYRMEGVPIDTRNVKDWMDVKKPSFLHHSS